MWQIHVGYNGSPKLQPSYTLFFRWLYTTSPPPPSPHNTTSTTTSSFWVLHFWSSTSTHYTQAHYSFIINTIVVAWVSLTLPTHHTSPKRTERKGGSGEEVIDYLLAGCAVQQNKTKKIKTIWENLQLKQTNGWLEHKERVESEIKGAFSTTTVIRQLWVPYWGLQPTFVSIICMYVCMCVCVCVRFSQIFLEGLT